MMYFKLIDSLTDALPKKYREASLEFTKLINGISNAPTRSIKCYDVTSATFQYPIGLMYVTKNFDEKARIQVKNISPNPNPS